MCYSQLLQHVIVLSACSEDDAKLPQFISISKKLVVLKAFLCFLKVIWPWWLSWNGAAPWAPDDYFLGIWLLKTLFIFRSEDHFNEIIQNSEMGFPGNVIHFLFNTFITFNSFLVEYSSLNGKCFVKQFAGYCDISAETVSRLHHKCYK